MKLYQNILTTEKHSLIQLWRTIKNPALGAGNTTKHEGQTYLCMSDGSFFGHLDYQTSKYKSVFLAGAPNMTSWTPKGFYHLCMTMEKAGAINQVWIFSYYCRRRNSESNWCFTYADQDDIAEADLPIKYQSKINGWGVQIMTYLRKVLPTKEGTPLLDV